MKLRPGIGLIVLSALLILLAPLLLLRNGEAWAVPSGVPVWRWVAMLVFCGICYIMSHIARATRLAMISGQMLGVSLRSTALAHLFIAPWSIILPFKLDEILRWRELARISRQPPLALIACAIDRTADGVVLLALLLNFSGIGGAAGVRIVMLFLGLAVGLSIFLFILAPSMLELVQQYLFEHNFGRRAVTLLALVHVVRIELARGRETIARTSSWLVVCTLFAWSLEFAAVSAVFVLGLGHSFVAQPMVTIMLERASRSSSLLRTPVADGLVVPEVTLSVVFFAALMLIWLVSTPAYLRRWADEPRYQRTANLPSFQFPTNSVSR